MRCRRRWSRGAARRPCPRRCATRLPPALASASLALRRGGCAGLPSPYGRNSRLYEQLQRWLCMSWVLSVRGALVLRGVSGSSCGCPSRSEREARERTRVRVRSACRAASERAQRSVSVSVSFCAALRRECARRILCYALSRVVGGCVFARFGAVPSVGLVSVSGCVSVFCRRLLGQAGGVAARAIKVPAG